MTYMPGFSEPHLAASNEPYSTLDADLLVEASREGLSRMLRRQSAAAPEAVYQQRLEAELEVIVNHGYGSYFLIVADYVQWAKDNGIAVGPGRGSGPCSLVGYALGITAVDPIRYGLPFERFVNPERNSVPDFDLDFCDARRSEVTRYIQRKYGAGRVAHISSVDNTPLASRLIICDRPLTQVVPLQSSVETDLPTASITLSKLSDVGLVQFNVINQPALTLIQKVCNQLAHSGATVDINNISLNDAGAYKLLSDGEPCRISELDGEEYQSALRAVQPERFEELAAVIVMRYPRAHGAIDHYVKQKQNNRLADSKQPMVRRITHETYGLILYQEQVMQIAHEAAGYSWAQSDTFRRKLTNGDPETVQVLKTRFIFDANTAGLTKTAAEEIFEQLLFACQQCFNKSHAVAYALIAYQIAWLKANYPGEFEAVTSAF